MSTTTHAKQPWTAQALIAGFAAAAITIPVSAQWAPPYWEVSRAGLADAQHTAADGFQQSLLVPSAAPGYLIGWAARFSGPAVAGQSAWVWSEAVGTTRVGLIDAAHTAADGTQSSTPRGVGADGRVVGVSARYSGAAAAGQSAWTWTGSEGVTRLGFADAPHTATDGAQYSDTVGVSDSGRAAGVSYRYNGLYFSGQSAWAWSAGLGTQRLGFTDSAHTSTAGVQYSSAAAINGAGQVVGSSKRYAAAIERGESAWIWTGGTTTRIGLVDAGHTATNGQQTSRPTGLSNSGQVTGTSAHYQGAFYIGDSAWTWTSGLGTARIGLVDAGHTSSGGGQYSTATALNSAGRVIGRSTRFNGLAETGQSAWQWSVAEGTLRLGFTDAQHTGSAGYQFSAALRVSEPGAIIGYSSRYTGGADAGATAWVWTSAGGLVALGLSGAEHTRADGYRFSWPVAINAAGQIAGYTERYSGSVSAGDDGWFYDPVTGVTTPLTFSTASDGSVMTAPMLLTEAGWVLGNFMLYSGNTQLGYRAFAWSTSRGYAELGSLVEGGAGTHGWVVLSQPAAAWPDGDIAGSGSIQGAPSSSAGVFVLVAPTLACGPADVGVAGGLAGSDGMLDNNDFIAFINLFFDEAPSADRGVAGGLPGSDGAFDNNDFIAFITQFFDGC